MKTAEGGIWAARLARAVTELGGDVHVALPRGEGEAIAFWRNAGATLHVVDCGFPLSAPQEIMQRLAAIRALVAAIRPDLIHCHFVTNAVMMRLALGKRHAIPRIFQVPGPLHLEHPLFRILEIGSAGESDYWVASSRYTQKLYEAAGVERKRIYLSYYGTDLDRYSAHRTWALRSQCGISSDKIVVGNISFIYPPKYYLGQTVGLKGHEDLIEVIRLVAAKHPQVVGVFVGGQWGGGNGYERRLAMRAKKKAGERIIFAGRVPQGITSSLWPDYDCAVHAPLSENCGGVVEPLVSGVPTVATQVGGIPEVIIDGITGWIAPCRDLKALADAVVDVIEKPRAAARRVSIGQSLVRQMFDIRRTAMEIFEIYSHIYGNRSAAPPSFDSKEVAAALADSKVLLHTCVNDYSAPRLVG